MVEEPNGLTFLVNRCLVVFILEGNPMEAIRRHDELIEAYPDFGALNFWKSVALVVAGKFEEAIEEARKFVTADGGSSNSRMQLAWVFGAAGKREEAEEILSKAIADEEGAFISPAIIGSVKLVLGQKDEGYAWLEKALSERDPALLYFNGFPWTKEYRVDPRWAAIEEKLGFASSPDSGSTKSLQNLRSKVGIKKESALSTLAVAFGVGAYGGRG